MNAVEIKNLEIKLEELVKAERAVQERERFDTLLDLYNTFMEDKSDIKSSVYLNNDLLAIAVGSYFDDIYRYKMYSHSERADKHKQGAYIIKWLSKIRPIQVCMGAKATKEMLFINSSFAVFVGFSFLGLNVFDAIEPHLYEHLLYEAQYRKISGKSYASILYLIEKAAEKR
ncbi:MAG: hypothetical protein LBJ57_06435 [Prevotellaceae bacterium]|jgi:hypothetical protein|nr:hypothetical protein [Prevotellaceae bacterium]